MEGFFRNFGKRHVLLIAYSLVLIAGVAKIYGSAAEPVFLAPAARTIVLIDPGHGGWDPGKIDGAGRLEKDINLAIAKKLQTALEIGGGSVFTTRLTDTALADRKRADLNKRRALADELHADILVSIHQNSFPDKSAQGAQVFYYGDSIKSQKLAEFIQNRMNEDRAHGSREAKPNESYYLLKKTSIPAVIIECGFMTNPSDAANLQKESYQEDIAQAIYLGILDFYEYFMTHGSE